MDEARITLEGDDVDPILWVRNRKKSWYEVNGEPYRKGATPPEMERLGILEITTPDGKVHHPQFHRQTDSPFILDESPPTAAALIGASPEVARVGRAIKLCGKRRNEAKTLTTVLETQAIAAEDRLALLVPHEDAVSAAASAASEAYATTKAHRAALAKAEILDQKLVAAEELVRVTTLAGEIPPIPDISSLREATAVQLELHKAEKLASIPVEVTKLPKLPSLDFRELAEAEKLATRLEIANKLATLDPGELPDLDAIQELTANLREWDGLADALLSAVKDVEEIDRELDHLRAEQDDLEHREAEIMMLLRGQEACPLCEAVWPLGDSGATTRSE